MSNIGGEKKTVIVIGGGYSGCPVAKQLDSKFNVILIERKKTFFHNVGAPRLLTEYDFYKRLYMPYDKLLRNGKIIHQTVRELRSTNVLLDNNDEISFDYCVIATGSNNPVPFKSILNINNAPQYINELLEQVKLAKKILIVGGGAVGVEVAGELAYKYQKEKEITIINSSYKLVSHEFNEKFHFKLNTKLKDYGVNVLVDRIPLPENIKESLKTQRPISYTSERKIYTTESGREIEADLVFWTVGNKVNNELLQPNFSHLLNEQGRIKVNDSLQVEGYSNIFAIGDITSIPELKTSLNAVSHSDLVIQNIQLLESGKLNLKEYKSSKPGILISLGPKDGIAQFFGIIISSSILCSIMKSKSLFVERFYKELNSPNPYNFTE